MKYYSAIKKNEIMPFAATWMDQENFELSEIIQAQKDKYCMTSLIHVIENSHIEKSRELNDNCQGLEGWGGRGWGDVGQRVENFSYAR